MPVIEPIEGEPAAVADGPEGPILVVADYHAGIEGRFRREGVEAESHAAERRERLTSLLDRVDPVQVLFLGDLGDHIGQPDGAELEELMELEHRLRDREVHLVPGNHDGMLGDAIDVTVTPGTGVRIGDLGFAHGHTWPDPSVLDVSVLALGHEHPCVRLEDEVGGSRVERVWLRGDGDPAPFEEHYDADIDGPDEIVVFPAFNELVGGTWVNVPGQEFLAPFLPAAAPTAQAYLLDGTRLGQYDSI
ncbi:metallophosphoesterase [Halodesulfurarchaeum formicicum]|uniref:Metallophosphoesterase n=1 Tax=Halodesulfurarchaeum formicicum TaxID=1873524 RepID=A0A1D8S3J8_9EURY|nr:metallophosphoesterase [Halodesulfurarchaeum formicicum]AOW79929.1 metallophosphoesterase [Halodesulfurarchaeum formicicum]